MKLILVKSKYWPLEEEMGVCVFGILRLERGCISYRVG